MRNPAGVLIPLLSILFLAGFTIPSPHELRREFREELQKIKESTPGAKALARWRELKAKAKEEITSADINMAQEFASKQYEEALYLFQRARRYAAKKAYKKASYLARKSIELASSATKEAIKAREQREKVLRRRLERLKKLLDELKAKLSYRGDYSTSVADFYLRWSDIRHAVSLGEYPFAEKAVADLEHSVRKFIKESGIEIETGQDKWEETI